MSSYTVSITSTSSTLQSILFPALRLNPEKLWEVALLDLTTYNSIPNVIEGVNNKFHYYKKKDNSGKYSSLEEIYLTTGSYEIDDINQVIQRQLGKDNITLKGNNNTMKAEIVSPHYIDFSKNLYLNS